jgi:hypothetical protein
MGVPTTRRDYLPAFAAGNRPLARSLARFSRRRRRLSISRFLSDFFCDMVISFLDVGIEQEKEPAITSGKNNYCCPTPWFSCEEKTTCLLVSI